MKIQWESWKIKLKKKIQKIEQKTTMMENRSKEIRGPVQLVQLPNNREFQKNKSGKQTKQTRKPSNYSRKFPRTEKCVPNLIVSTKYSAQ